jgi:hypothetical protein
MTPAQLRAGAEAARRMSNNYRLAAERNMDMMAHQHAVGQALLADLFNGLSGIMLVMADAAPSDPPQDSDTSVTGSNQ